MMIQEEGNSTRLSVIPTPHFNNDAFIIGYGWIGCESRAGSSATQLFWMVISLSPWLCCLGRTRLSDERDITSSLNMCEHTSGKEYGQWGVGE